MNIDETLLEFPRSCCPLPNRKDYLQRLLPSNPPFMINLTKLRVHPRNAPWNLPFSISHKRFYIPTSINHGSRISLSRIIRALPVFAFRITCPDVAESFLLWYASGTLIQCMYQTKRFLVESPFFGVDEGCYQGPFRLSAPWTFLSTFQYEAQCLSTPERASVFLCCEIQWVNYAHFRHERR